MKKLALVLITIVCLTHAAWALDAPILSAPTGTTTPHTQFNWNDVAGATWYRIWVSADTSPGTAVVSKWVETVSSYLVTSALPVGDYTCWLQSWSPTEGYSAWSGGFGFSVGNLQLITLHPADFQPRYSSYNWSLSGTGLATTTPNSYWYASLNLPTGVELFQVILSVRNSGVLPSGQGPSLWLDRRRVYDGAGGNVATISMTGSIGSGYQNGADFSLINPTIANAYAYSIDVFIRSTQTTFTGVRVYYWAK